MDAKSHRHNVLGGTVHPLQETIKIYCICESQSLRVVKKHYTIKMEIENVPFMGKTQENFHLIKKNQ